MRAADVIHSLLLQEVFGLMPDGSGASDAASSDANTITKEFSLQDPQGKRWQFFVDFSMCGPAGYTAHQMDPSVVPNPREVWDMSFGTTNGSGSMFVKQGNRMEFAVMKMIAQICREFVADKRPALFAFSAADDAKTTDPRKKDNRAELYLAMSNRLSKELNYSLVFHQRKGRQTYFVLKDAAARQP